MSSHTDGSDTPLIQSSPSPPKIQNTDLRVKADLRVIFADKEALADMPADISRTSTDGSDTPLAF